MSLFEIDRKTLSRAVSLSLALFACAASMPVFTRDFPLLSALEIAPAFAQAASADPSQKEKAPFKADTAPPDMVVDERTELEMLRDLGDSLRKLEHAATETIKEVNRHAPAQVNMQDIVDEQVLNPFWYDPFNPGLNAALRNGPLLPPRKKWLDIEVSGVGQVVSILQREISALSPPIALSTTAKDSFKVEVGLMTEANSKIQSSNDELKQLAQGPNYDNDKIGKVAHEIRTNAKTIDECRKRAAKALVKK